jgi:tetratricopeptide (TPR) repeat protein
LNQHDKTQIEQLMRDKLFEKALVILASTLERQPDNINALYYSAVCLRYLNRLNEALQQLTALRKMAPNYGRGLQEEGHIYRAKGNLKQALHLYTRATHANPSLQGSWRSQIEILLKQGREAEAIRLKPHLQRVLQMPQPLIAAMDYIAQGKLSNAENLCREFLKQHPHHVEAMRLLAEVGMKLNILHDAEFLLESALKLEPENNLLRIDYIEALRKRQKIEAAHAEVLTLHKANPDNVHFESLYAVLCMQMGDYDKAIQLFDKILTKIPGDPVTLTSKGHALKTCGNTQEAIASYRDATQSSSAYGEAWHSLANLKTVKFSDTDITKMLAQLENDELKFMDRVYINFTLGKAFEDAEEFDQAFSHYAAGNKAKKAQTRYFAEQMTDEFEYQKKVFTKQFVSDRKNFGHSAPDPIFVVGLPRAGSTLLEQILSSHSQVDGTLELPNVLALVNDLRRGGNMTGDNLYPSILETLDTDKYREFGEAYIRDTKVHRQDAPFFIDKMPNNFRHIGLIKLMLPNAKIIDARRHPMGCCFSGYKQLFAEGQAFSYDLNDAGQYYRDYQSLMDTWQAIFPDQILHVQYEDVVNDFEAQVRRILDYCGLPFEEACLSFYKTERAVRTPSSEQVRQPIYRGGIDQWKNFEAHLDPLKESLGSVLDDYPM